MKSKQTLQAIAMLMAAGAVCAVTPAWGQQAKSAAAVKPNFPGILPGRGLAQHDFFYAGEARSQDMYIVRNGKIAWEFHDPAGKGEISGAVLLSSGNILFAHQFGVTLIDREKKVLWRYDAPAGTEVHTAQPIGKDRVLFVQNGDLAKVVVVNIVTGKTEREFVVPVRDPKSVHGHFRHARLTDAGTLLIAHMDMSKIVEYDSTGKPFWSYTPGAATWSAERLKNGNTLIAGAKLVREVNPAGAVVWEFTPADVPDYLFNSMQIAKRLPNGNTLINTWFNQWNGPADPGTAPVQALEVTPEKRVVWTLRAWGSPVNLGPSTTVQLLDEPTVPEAVHFGDLGR
jgi:outer membrane protein assembly factor BamB